MHIRVMNAAVSSQSKYITRSISMTWEQKWAYRKLQKIYKEAVKNGLPDDKPIEDISAIAKQVLSPKDRFRFYAAIATTGDAWDSEDAASAFSRYISFEKAPVLTAVEAYKLDFRERLENSSKISAVDKIAAINNAKKGKKQVKEYKSFIEDIGWLAQAIKGTNKSRATVMMEDLSKLTKQDWKRVLKFTKDTVVHENYMWINSKAKKEILKGLEKNGSFLGVIQPFLNYKEKVEDLAEKYKDGDYLGMSVMLLVEAMTLPGMPPNVQAIGKALGVSTFAAEKGGSLLGDLYAKYIDQRDAVVSLNTDINRPIKVEILNPDFESVNPNETTEETTEEISPPECEQEWSDYHKTFVDTCTGDFNKTFKYSGVVSVDSSSRTQVAGNQRRDRFNLTRLDGDAGSYDPFIPKVTTQVSSDELVRLWVGTSGLNDPTWEFVFYGSTYMEARRRCLNKTRRDDDQLSFSQVEKMFLDGERGGATYVNGVYNGFNDKPLYRIDLATGYAKNIDVIKAEAVRALPESEDWATASSYVCIESIYPDSRAYELELIPMAYS